MNKVYYISTNDSLYHHGIKGQKWGIRRYQNEDGSLTSQGEARYGTVENMNKVRSRNKKIAVGVGVGVAAAGAAYLVSKNSKLKRANRGLSNENDALYDAAKKIANRNKGLKGENAQLKGSLNRWNDKLLEAGKEIDQYERKGSILVDKLTVSNRQRDSWQNKFNSLSKNVMNRDHTLGLKEYNTRANKSAGQKKRYAKEAENRAKGLVKKYINKGDGVTTRAMNESSYLGTSAKKVGIWVKDGLKI